MKILIPLSLVLLLSACPAYQDPDQPVDPAGLYTGSIDDGGERSTVIGLATSGGDLRLLDERRGISLRATFAPYASTDADIVANGALIESGYGPAWLRASGALDIEATITDSPLPRHQLVLELDRLADSDRYLGLDDLTGEWLGEQDASWVEFDRDGFFSGFEDQSGCEFEGFLDRPEFGAVATYRTVADLDCPHSSSRGQILLGVTGSLLIVGLVEQGLPYVFTAR